MSVYHFNDQFVAKSDALNSQQIDDGTAAVKIAVQKRLVELQRGHYRFIIGSLDETGALQSSTEELSGAKALLESMIALGFSQSLENDDFVRSLLFGSERLPDANAIKDLCNIGIERSYDSNQNAKVDIGLILDERINALENWITNRLAQIDRTKRTESFSLVTSTLERIKAFQAAQSAQSVQPYIHVLGFPGQVGTNALFHLSGEPNVRYLVQTPSDLARDPFHFLKGFPKFSLVFHRPLQGLELFWAQRTGDLFRATLTLRVHWKVRCPRITLIVCGRNSPNPTSLRGCLDCSGNSATGCANCGKPKVGRKSSLLRSQGSTQTTSEGLSEESATSP